MTTFPTNKAKVSVLKQFIAQTKSGQLQWKFEGNPDRCGYNFSAIFRAMSVDGETLTLIHHPDLDSFDDPQYTLSIVRDGSATLIDNESVTAWWLYSAGLVRKLFRTVQKVSIQKYQKSLEVRT